MCTAALVMVWISLFQDGAQRQQGNGCQGSVTVLSCDSLRLHQKCLFFLLLFCLLVCISFFITLFFTGKQIRVVSPRQTESELNKYKCVKGDLFCTVLSRESCVSLCALTRGCKPVSLMHLIPSCLETTLKKGFSS